jgi:Lon protease-like protein
MPQDELPLFPLGVVLLPGAVLPLHIFEERYKEMIAEVERQTAERQNGEFGVVFANDKGMSSIGCVAAIEEVLRRYPDGRLDILTRGRRRFEVLFVDESRNYLQASVVDYPDEDLAPADPALRERVFDLWKNLIQLEHNAAVGSAVDANRNDLSFFVGDSIPVLEFRQNLLVMRGERQRLEAIADFLPRYLERESISRHIRRVAPLNGFSKHTSAD